MFIEPLRFCIIEIVKGMIHPSTPETLDDAKALIARLIAHIERLEDRLEALEKTPRNSSKPPSSEHPHNKTTKPKKRSGKKRGGQKGHPKQERPVVPPEQVDKFVDSFPTCCEGCHAVLPRCSVEKEIYQQWEIPEIKPFITQTTAHVVQCPECKRRNTGPTTEQQRCGYGPRVDATVAQMMMESGASKRQVAELMSEVYQVPMSPASVVAAQTRVSQAVQLAVTETHEAAKQELHKHADETPWKEGTKRGYLWTLVTPVATVFVIAMSRAGDVARALLGTSGTLVTDRYSGYLWWAGALHQFCWAHLKRDFVAMSERTGLASEVGAKLVEETERMFWWWSRFKNAEMSRKDFDIVMRGLQERVKWQLQRGVRARDKKARGLCKTLLRNEASLWVFLSTEGVEPTNNAAEQAVRHGVLWRKRSHGTQSEKGSRFVERMLTVRATLRAQKRGTFEYLVKACEAHRKGLPSPSLLKDPSPSARQILRKESIGLGPPR